MAFDLTIAPVHGTTPATPAQRAGQVPVPVQPAGASGVPFSDFLNSAIAQTIATDLDDKLTNVGLMVGDLTDLHTATLAAQRAEIALSLTLQIRNKIVESYQEIMRMNV